MRRTARSDICSLPPLRDRPGALPRLRAPGLPEVRAPAPERLIVADCTDCGAAVNNKNAAGHYRDRCLDCLAEAARTERHVTTCERDGCPVCYSHPDGDADTVRYEHL